MRNNQSSEHRAVRLKTYKPTGLPTAGSQVRHIRDREGLSEFLRAKGFRLTPQREKILDIFYELPAGEHLSAEELQEQLQNENSDISLATSYRTLKLLASLGVLRELDFAEQHKHYELIRDAEAPHHHIICLNCGRMEEFESDEIVELSTSLATERGFQVVDVQLKLYGFCCERNSSDK
ncbi:MAG TPA: transcriptional repressor [Oculatellaceae cyanobacterium]|jgi:Fur family ferric uptake transcriptional regulator